MLSRSGISAALVCVLLGLVLVSGACGLDTTASKILEDPDKFDGKTVTITGTVVQLRTTVSRKGNPYYTYDLHDGARAIRVFSFGKPVCAEGTTATIEGRFTKVKRVSGQAFYNEVEAKTERCR
jgi:hypothetical protein